jgi:hypothetical protein
VFGLCCTKRNCVDHSTHADPLMKPLQEPGLLVSADLRARQPSYHRCSSARPDRTLSRRAPRPGSVLQKGKTHASSGVRTRSSRKSLKNFARWHGCRTPEPDPAPPKVGRLHGIPAHAVHVDRRLRPVVARMERHTLANYTWALPGSSCTPPHGPLPRESPAVPPVYLDRVPKGQKGSRVQFQKNQTKGKGSAAPSWSGPGARRRRLWAPWAWPAPVSRSLARCAALHRQIWGPRPVATGNAHTGRAAALSGPHRLDVGCGRSAARIQFHKKQRKGKGAAGSNISSGPRPAAASAQVTPFVP